MVLEHQSSLLIPFRQMLISVVLPIQKMVDFPYTFTSRVIHFTQQQNKILNENSHLNEQNLILQSMVQKVQFVETENNQLKQMLSAKESRPEKMILASVMNIDSKMHQQQFMIDKGSVDNVYVGQSVVDAKGIVGMVSELSPSTARVLMVTDLNFAIPIQNARSGLRAIAEGSGFQDKMIIRNLATSSDIKPGDLLISSGLGGYFSAGFLVAKVQNIRQVKGQAFMEVDLKPTANLEQNRYVLLVWNLNRTGTKEPLHPIVPEFKTEAERKAALTAIQQPTLPAAPIAAPATNAAVPQVNSLPNSEWRTEIELPTTMPADSVQNVVQPTVPAVPVTPQAQPPHKEPIQKRKNKEKIMWNGDRVSINLSVEGL